MKKLDRDGVLGISGRIAPPVLALAFILSYWTAAGTVLIIPFCAWYAVFGWRKALRSVWVQAVLGFFLLLALKDFLSFLAGSGTFRSFAKSGSRGFVLLGAASFLALYGKDKAEWVFLSALAGVAAAMGIYWALFTAHLSLGWPKAFDETLQRNVPGQLSLWFPLGILLYARKMEGRFAPVWRIAAFAFGEVFMIFLSLSGGWRVGPLAFAVLGLGLFLPWPRVRHYFVPSLLLLSLLALFGLMGTSDRRFNRLLFYRIDLWNAYAAKAMERPLLGWGYSEPERNKDLAAEDLKGTMAFEEFAQVGLGPHNAYIAMVFENGLVALAGFVALLFFRAFSIRSPPSFFDLSFAAFIFLLALDAMNPGGLRFLGFFLSFCLIGDTE